MADRYDRDPIYDDFDGTDGGEATPRPLKAQRLVDMMEPSAKGKGTGRSAAEAAPTVWKNCRIKPVFCYIWQVGNICLSLSLSGHTWH